MSETRVALVTGASQGIGYATAEQLSRAGFSVLLVADCAESELEAAMSRCAGDDGRCAALRLDLGEPEAPAAMIEAALNTFGRLDVLVNNAAIRIRHPFGEYEAAEFDRLMAVNVRAAFMASQAAVPIMKGQQGGRIIHVASQIGLVAFDQSALYGLSKASLIYLARAMAFELAPFGIRVNAVSPGPVATEYNFARFERDPGLQARRSAEVPAGRYGRPEEVAQLICFLAYEAPDYLLGENIVIDGGYVSH